MLAAGARHVFLPRFDGAALLGAVRAHGVTAFIAGGWLVGGWGDRARPGLVHLACLVAAPLLEPATKPCTAFDQPPLPPAIPPTSLLPRAVPAMVADLLAAAAAAGVPTLPSVRRILVGGGGMPPALQRGLAALCPAATVHTAYGMTEAASSLTFATLWGPGGGSPNSFGRSSGSAAGPPGGVLVGSPPPGIELAVLQLPADGAASGAFPGSSSGSGGSGGSGRGGGSIRLAGAGEVVTRGPHTMLGYWADDDATAAAMLPGGWMRTGDLGCLSSGAYAQPRGGRGGWRWAAATGLLGACACTLAALLRLQAPQTAPDAPRPAAAGQLWLLGRAKDMIKSGGENVHAWEVERCLASHPAVALAAVVGAADWRLGEAVAAAVVLRPGWRWVGARCQVLLAAQPGGAGAARLALVAAAAAVAPAARRGGTAGSGGEEQRAARGSECSTGQPGLTEDWRSTLLQRGAASRGLGSPGSEAGLLADSIELPPEAAEQRAVHPGAALRQLHAVAAGLQHAVSSGGGGSGSSPAAADAAGGAGTVDGPALQQHCRAAGLAGFKLPRVFLRCDAAGGAAFPPAVGSAGSGAAVLLPTNSTGKVVKHLLRAVVQEHMAAARAGGGGGGAGGLRSRM